MFIRNGPMSVTAGTLLINGNQTAATGAVTVANITTLIRNSVSTSSEPIRLARCLAILVVTWQVGVLDYQLSEPGTWVFPVRLAELHTRDSSGFGTLRNVQPPITLLVRLQQACGLLLVAGLIFLIGLVLLRAIGKSSPSRLRHGKFVLSWMLGGWLVGSAVGVSILDNQSYFPNEADAGIAGFGLLVGWGLGMLHGGNALALSPTQKLD
jgi:hypothetical protein